MNKIFKRGLIAEAVLAGIFFAPLVAASSLDLPTTPLVSGTSVDPNVMFLLDSSGSMYNVVAEEDEIDDDYSYTCDSDNQISSSGKNLHFRYIENNNGSVTTSIFDKTGKNSYTFGNDDDEYCFDNDSNYKVGLNYEQEGFRATYTGSYLNWYFDSETGTYGYDSDSTDDDDNDIKEGTYTRLEGLKEVVEDLVGDLTDMRVGISQFYEKYGAQVLVGLDDIEDSDHNKDLVNAVDGLDIYKSTPLLEAVQDLGWYFSADTDSGYKLSLHDGDDDETSCSASEAFYYDATRDGDDVSTDKSTDDDGTKSDTINPSYYNTTVQQYWCQQNFVVLMTDGQPAHDTSFTEQMEGYNDYSDYSYFDNNSNTADVLSRLNIVSAMYDTDLRPDISEDDDDKTEVINNVTTYVIGFADESVTSSSFMDSLAEAGGSEDFLTASDSSELSEAFMSAAESIYAETAAMSSISLDSTSISSDSALFQASFSTSSWTGSFSAYEFDSSGDVEDDETWNAADKLDDLSTTVSSGTWDDVYDRNIFTYNEDTSKGVEFSYTNLSAAQKKDLLAGPDLDDDGSAEASEAKELVNYIYGDDTYEGTSDNDFRERSSLLGDIVNSTSVYVGAPELSWPDYTEDSKFGASDNNYSSFVSSNKSRAPIVYVGANDGMLHGFNADMDDSDTGHEVMAYIPGIIASSDDDEGMHYLADTNYAHRFYVDLSPTVSDVYLNSGDDSGKDWHSLLIGGLRAGGKGLFALDVTDPDDFDTLSSKADDLVLWEFSSDDDSDFGYSYSKPTVAMMQNGEWAVIVGNGYNNGGGGTAELFILFIDKGTDGTWSTTDYVKINTEVGSKATPNGLTTPTVVDEDGDSVADYVYVGDLQGNMWKFDVSSSSTSDWDVAFEDVDDSTPEPLFTATDSDGTGQPITSPPLVTSYDSDLMIFFGAGKYLEESDLSDTSEMSYYGVLDEGTGALTRSNLTSRTLLTNSGLRKITGDDWESSSTSSGWYLNLVNQSTSTGAITYEGERVISESTKSGDILFFNTVIPDSTECSYGGDSWFMSVDITTGLAATYAVFDADGDGDIDDDDIGYVGESYSDGMVSSSTIVDSTQYTVDSTGTLVSRDVVTEDSSISGRVSWEEVINE